ncbi:MAG: SPOR domain-containing protein [Bacteroidota bacterium]
MNPNIFLSFLAGAFILAILFRITFGGNHPNNNRETYIQTPNNGFTFIILLVIILLVYLFMYSPQAEQFNQQEQNTTQENTTPKEELKSDGFQYIDYKNAKSEDDSFDSYDKYDYYELKQRLEELQNLSSRDEYNLNNTINYKEDYRNENSQQIYLQVNAFGSLENAQTNARNISNKIKRDVIIRVEDNYKVLIGPFNTREEALKFNNLHRLKGFIKIDTQSEEIIPALNTT